MLKIDVALVLRVARLQQRTLLPTSLVAKTPMSPPELFKPDDMWTTILGSACTATLVAAFPPLGEAFLLLPSLMASLVVARLAMDGLEKVAVDRINKQYDNARDLVGIWYPVVRRT